MKSKRQLLKEYIQYVLDSYNLEESHGIAESKDDAIFGKDVDRSDIYVHTNKGYKTKFPALGSGYYLFHVNSVAPEINQPVENGNNKYYKVTDPTNIFVFDSIEAKCIDLPGSLLEASKKYIKNSLDNLSIGNFLRILDLKLGEQLEDFMKDHQVDGIQIMDDAGLYNEEVTNETVIFNKDILSEVMPEIPELVNETSVAYRIVDFNNIKEIDPFIEDELIARSDNKDYKLIWRRLQHSKTGKLRMTYDILDLIAAIYEDREEHDDICAELYGNINEDELSNKWNIFQQIKQYRPNAKYENYKKMPPKQMLAILYKEIEKRQAKNNEVKEPSISDEEMAEIQQKLDYQKEHPLYKEKNGTKYIRTDNGGYEIVDESEQLNEANLKDLIDDSKATDPKRIKLSQSIYTEYKGVDSDGTLLFESDSQTRSGLTHKQRIFYNRFFELLDKADEGDRITDEDVVDILTGDLNVDCSCESFLYWAWAYKSWKDGYGLQKELRAPKRNNVNLNGGACKHVLSMLELLNRSDSLFDKIAEDLNDLFQKYKKQKKATNPDTEDTDNDASTEAPDEIDNNTPAKVDLPSGKANDAQFQRTAANLARKGKTNKKLHRNAKAAQYDQGTK